MNARMCDGNKAPHGLSRETLTLMGCVRLCYVPTFFFFFLAGVWGQRLWVAALESIDKLNFISGEKAGDGWCVFHLCLSKTDCQPVLGRRAQDFLASRDV